MGTSNKNGYSDEYGSNYDTNFSGPNGEDLGSSWSRSDAAGNSIETGYRFVVKFGDDTADGVFASQTKYEEVKEKVFDSSGELRTTETLFYDNDPVSATYGRILKGTKIENGVTYDLGLDGAIEGSTVDLTAAGAIDTILADLPSGFVTAAFGSVTTVQQTTENYDYGGSRTTYYNSADSSVLGYSEEMGSPAGGVGASSSNYTYYNASNQQIGNYFSDDFGSNSQFDQLLTDADGSVTGTSSTKYISQIGSESFKHNGVTNQTRTWEFKYAVDSEDKKLSFISGEDTITFYQPDGTTIETSTRSIYGANPNGLTPGGVVVSYDKDGNVMDPYVLFDLSSWTLESTPLATYISDNGLDPTYDGDYDGVADATTAFGESLIDHLLSPGVEPTVVEESSNVVGFDLEKEPYVVEMRGTFTLDGDGQVTTGNITGIEVYAYASSTKGALVATSGTLSIDWTDFAHT